ARAAIFFLAVETTARGGARRGLARAPGRARERARRRRAAGDLLARAIAAAPERASRGSVAGRSLASVLASALERAPLRRARRVPASGLLAVQRARPPSLAGEPVAPLAGAAVELAVRVLRASD